MTKTGIHNINQFLLGFKFMVLILCSQDYARKLLQYVLVIITWFPLRVIIVKVKAIDLPS